MDEDDRLSLYHDAWARVYAKRRKGEPIQSLRAYLLANASADALHMVTRRRGPMPVAPDDPRIEGIADDARPVDEQVIERDQVRIARGLLDTLDERQRDVLKLRWDLQLSGTEIRAALGLSSRQYRRLAEEGAEAIAQRVEELDTGRWSRRTRSLLVACVVEVAKDGERRHGIASRRQREEAARLLRSDPHVAALYAEIRRSMRDVAALAPLPVFVPVDDGAFARVIELTAALRSSLWSAAEGARHQATALYVRAADPTVLGSGPRPGAAAVAVAGALAVGGGAYGAYEAAGGGTAPSPRPSSVVQSSHAEPSPQPAATVAPAPPVRASQPTPSPVPAPKQPTPRAAPPVSAPTPAPVPPPPPSPPTRPAEFGFEQ